MKTLPLAAALAFALSPAAASQTAPPLVADCGPVAGTVRVADGVPVTPDMARVSLDDARAAALRAVPGATVTELELDEEDGFLVYEAELLRDGAEVDVTVDAGTGRVLCAERD